MWSPSEALTAQPLRSPPRAPRDGREEGPRVGRRVGADGASSGIRSVPASCALWARVPLWSVNWGLCHE